MVLCTCRSSAAMNTRLCFTALILVATMIPALPPAAGAGMRNGSALPLSGGDRIRIDSGRRYHWECWYAGVRNDSLGLARSPRDEASEWIPLEKVRRLEIPTGKRGHLLQGMGIGLALGALAGAAIGAAAGSSDEDYAPLYALVGAGGGAGAGMVLGGAIGAFIRTDRWTRIAADSEMSQNEAPARAELRLGVRYTVEK